MKPEKPVKLPVDTVVTNEVENDDQQPETSIIERGTDQQPEQTATASTQVFPGTGNFVRAARHSKPRKPSESKRQYILNFDGAELSEVIKTILGDTLKENFIISPKVSGTVTLETSNQLEKDELLPTLEMLLRMNGAVLIRENKLYRIEPAASALLGSRSPRLGGIGRQLPPGYHVRIVPLRYIGVTQMQKILTPLLPPKAIVHTDISRNLLMIAGTARELRNIMETVSIFDADALKGMSVGLYSLQNVDAPTIILELEKLLGEGADSPVAGMFRLLPIERLNAILVITPQPAYLDQAKLWIDRLDKTNSASSGGVHVFKVENVDAVELAQTLNDIFGGRKKKNTIPSATVAPDLKPKEISAKNKQPLRKNSPKKQLSLDDVGEVRIIADATNNSLVIVATAQEYEIIEEVIKKLDIVPLQVLVDATIIEVRLTDGLRYGLQWFFEHKGGSFLGTGILKDSTIPINPNVPATFAAAASGFSYVLAANDVSVVLNALASDSKINVVSSPSLMVLNNQEASIKVGDQISIRTSSTTNTSGGADPLVTSQFQQQDTGVTLLVKPRVNPGGLVIMDVDQKVDNAAEASFGDSGNPDIFQRQIKSSVAVQSGETLVLGGLISETTTESESGIPFLYNLPLIGFLFGTTDTSVVKQELVILITPRVVENTRDARAVTLEFKRKLTGIYEEVSDEKYQE